MRRRIPTTSSRNRAMRGRRSGGFGGRLIIGIVIALISIGTYYFGTQEKYNPITRETQRVSMTVDQEIQIGLQAAPQMARQFGGLHSNTQAQALIDAVGKRIVERSEARDTEYVFNFHLLADDDTINAFALPGGQIFIIGALFNRFESEAQLAGVLSHEIGHVVARHAAEQMAKARLTEGLAGAASVVIADPENPENAQMAAVVAQMVTMKHSREDELESDRLGVRFMADAGYNPHAMIEVMQILAEANNGQNAPEFFATHPNPERRIERIREAIELEFPDSVPADLAD